MANLPQSFSIGVGGFGSGGAAASSSSSVGAPADKDRKMQSAEQLVLDLSNPDLRENALLELSKVYFFPLLKVFAFMFSFYRHIA